MYKSIKIRDTVRVPPSKFGLSLQDSVTQALEEAYENRVDKDLGVVLAISKVEDIQNGRIIPGDGASYHDLKFEALTFQPKIHEVIQGKVSEITQFGAFVNLGPIDGLVHVSQVTDDFISYNEKTGVLSGKESKHVLKEGDEVRAKIVTISMKSTLADSKIGLTMRQPGLGKKEWIEEDKRKKKKTKKKA